MDQETNPPQNDLISWSFYEFDPNPRPSSWYFWFGIIAATGVVYGIFSDNFLFAIIIVLAALILFLENWRKPSMVNFSITPQGIHMGKNFYPMRELDEFWLAYQPPDVKLVYFKFRAAWRPLLRIPLEDINPLQLRQILLEYLPENLDLEEELLSDNLARRLRL